MTPSFFVSLLGKEMAKSVTPSRLTENAFVAKSTSARKCDQTRRGSAGPSAPENLERPCGRGLMLMRHYMSDITYHGPGNSVSMYKVARNGKR